MYAEMLELRARRDGYLHWYLYEMILVLGQRQRREAIVQREKHTCIYNTVLLFASVM